MNEVFSIVMLGLTKLGNMQLLFCTTCYYNNWDSQTYDKYYYNTDTDGMCTIVYKVFTIVFINQAVQLTVNLVTAAQS